MRRNGETQKTQPSEPVRSGNLYLPASITYNVGVGFPSFGSLMYLRVHVLLSSANASYEENMAALIEDAKAMAIGLFLSIGVSLIFCMLSVGLISWSALRQVTIFVDHQFACSMR